jgi:putative ABC transport system substrate-binding protein
MNRRDFIGASTSAGLLAGGAPGWLCAARAQQQNLPVIGLLDGVWGKLNAEVGRGLRENGIVNYKVDFGRRYQADPLAENAAEFVKQQVALILAFSNRAALTAKAVTNTTPIIFLADDPVAAGLVDRLNRPGGNLTGADSLVSGLTAKRIEIVRELVPTTDLVVLVTDPTNKPAHDIEIREAQAAVDVLGLQLSIIAWTGEHDFEPEFAALPRDRKAVLVFGWGLPFRMSRAPLAYLAERYGIPAISGDRQDAESGGVASFGTRLADGAHLMGVYAARVLKGDKPADLPVQQITKTELVINLWGAKALGFQVPSTLLARADEVIK